MLDDLTIGLECLRPAAQLEREAGAGLRPRCRILSVREERAGTGAGYEVTRGCSSTAAMHSR